MQFPRGHRNNLIFQMHIHTRSMFQYYHQPNLIKDFCSSQRSKMHGDVLQTTHLHYHQRDFHSCFQNQNEQKQVIKNLCGETLQLIQRGKTDEIITIHKRMMHFCRNTLKPNKRTRILLDSSGKTKAVTFASLVHRSTDIPNA